MNIPDNLKYSKDHEWVLVDGAIGIIGITDFAQSELGDVVYVDIDENLSEITKGEACGTIEAVKTVSSIFAPFSGKVIEINQALKDSPELLNSDPYGQGWILKAEISDPSEINDLMNADDYRTLIGQ